MTNWFIEKKIKKKKVEHLYSLNWKENLCEQEKE